MRFVMREGGLHFLFHFIKLAQAILKVLGVDFIGVEFEGHTFFV